MAQDRLPSGRDLASQSTLCRLENGGAATLATVAEDNADRRLSGLRVVTYDIPESCCAAYYPEANVLIPIDHHARESHVPAAKSVPVRVLAE